MSLAFKWLKQAFEVNTPLRWMGVIHTSAGAVLFQSGCGENKTALGWFSVWRPFKHPRSGNLCCCFFFFFSFPSRRRIQNSAQYWFRTEVFKVSGNSQLAFVGLQVTRSAQPLWLCSYTRHFSLPWHLVNLSLVPWYIHQWKSRNKPFIFR